MLQTLREYLFHNQSTPPCSGPGSGVLTTVRVFSGQCVSFIVSESGVASCNFCSGAYCKVQCDLCHDPTPPYTVHESCTASLIGTADCNAISDFSGITYYSVAANQWGYQYSTCYFIGCDSNY